MHQNATSFRWPTSENVLSPALASSLFPGVQQWGCHVVTSVHPASNSQGGSVSKKSQLSNSHFRYCAPSVKADMVHCVHVVSALKDGAFQAVLLPRWTRRVFLFKLTDRTEAGICKLSSPEFWIGECWQPRGYVGSLPPWLP